VQLKGPKMLKLNANLEVGRRAGTSLGGNWGRMKSGHVTGGEGGRASGIGAICGRKISLGEISGGDWSMSTDT